MRAQKDLQRGRAVLLPARELFGMQKMALAPWTCGDQSPLFDRQACHLRPRAFVEGGHLVEMGLGPGNDPGAALGIKIAGFWQIAQSIGAIKRVVKAAKTGIGRVQGISCVADGDDKLGAGKGGNLGVDARGFQREIRAFGQQIANLGQKGLIGRRVMRLAPPFNVPGVDPGLQILALGQQRPVFRTQIGQGLGKTLPECASRNTRSRQSLPFDEICQGLIDLQPCACDPCHSVLPAFHKGLDRSLSPRNHPFAATRRKK